MPKKPVRKPKPPIGGLDSVWVLAVKFHTTTHPTHFLTDHNRFPGDGPSTTQPGHARRWSESSGPRQFVLRHPELRRTHKPFRIVGGLDIRKKK